MARQINVLLVADDGLTRTIAADGLAMYGYGVVTARDGEDAVEQLKTHRRIDVLVTDAAWAGSATGSRWRPSPGRSRRRSTSITCRARRLQPDPHSQPAGTSLRLRPRPKPA